MAPLPGRIPEEGRTVQIACELTAPFFTAALVLDKVT